MCIHSSDNGLVLSHTPRVNGVDCVPATQDPQASLPVVKPLTSLTRLAAGHPPCTTTIRATVYSLLGGLRYWCAWWRGGGVVVAPDDLRRDAGAPLEEFSLTAVIEDGVCVDAVLSHGLLAQLLGVCACTLFAAHLVATGYAVPADFVGALQDAGSAQRARDAVQQLSAKLQQFAGHMRVQWRGCHQPLVVLELLSA